ncbi:hypothetical protein HXX76_005136 [Chlamydomonas incerta]|uniref:Uncharacterized protein n=1 Tax=Chlamydomonas incerta TaxID=51695 RepID=A0A835T6Z2_CHLIN|nr:hypothetical protein HXX76_005136 [Chlamydomonas incerta]|eukprot:KAG2438586.1 hypothetical protein HXX76_005136 [Chlamydomonas incerta]
MSGVPVSFRLRRVWWSAKTSPFPVTIFTTATLDRLDMLETQCKTYPGGPHAAAVYVPLVQEHGGNLTIPNEQLIALAESRVQALFSRMEGIVNACHMHVLLLYEVTSDPALAHLTPINALRNAALLAVRTPLLVMVDVDLCVSASLVRFLSEPSNGDKLVASSSNTFWVLPAWDVSAGLSRVEIDHIAESALAGDKMTLAKLWASGRLHWFGQLYFQLGHAPTNYTRWLLSRKSYLIDYSIGYEPWGILSRDRQVVVPYDARFRGCYNDKITQVVTLHHSRILFRALPNAWVVHRPHTLNPAAGIAKNRTGSTTSLAGVGSLSEVVSLYGKNVSKFEHHKDWSHVLLDDSIVRMLAARYRPFPGRAYAYCRSVLPWMQNLKKQNLISGEYRRRTRLRGR